MFESAESVETEQTFFHWQCFSPKLLALDGRGIQR
jgi:hypothetical protein